MLGPLDNQIRSRRYLQLMLPPRFLLWFTQQFSTKQVIFLLLKVNSSTLISRTVVSNLFSIIWIWHFFTFVSQWDILNWEVDLNKWAIFASLGCSHSTRQTTAKLSRGKSGSCTFLEVLLLIFLGSRFELESSNYLTDRPRHRQA